MDAKTKSIFFLPVFLLAFAGCMKLDFMAEDIPVPVVMNGHINRPYKTVAHFKVMQQKSGLFLSRMIEEGKPDVNEMILRQLKVTPGDAVINVRIHGETEFADALLPVLVGIVGSFITPYFSFFIVEPLFVDLKSFTVEGDVIQFTDIKPPEKQKYIVDPLTGLPMEEERTEFDPETGLPKK